ncbi:MAG: glycosyl hydrolase [Anaerolineae bacterium]|nr:glycosyl hydrolase [Thermoflexales bacterium]MDW8408085.1 glycosyl hydrolase [Anaerolineae bacterium]
MVQTLFCPLLIVGLALIPSTRPAIAAPDVPQNPRLGLTFSNYFAGNPMYARAREAGATYDRVEFQMRAIRPAPAVWEWQAYDALVADEAAHGLRTLAVLTAPPTWAADLSIPYESWPVPANLHLPWNHPDNHWAQFVYQVVLRYRATVKDWQVWNEPDIRAYWKMPQAPASLFAQLLRVSYQAIKAADPQATVVLAGFLYRHDQWPSPITVWNAIRDLPDSAAHNNYFDVAAFHLYDGGTCEVFDVIEDFRQNMTRPDRGGLLPHPLWVTETGIRHWDGYSGSPPPGARYAWPDEAASFLIQNYTYALYKNVGRYYYFRTTDDGSPEQWGLIRLDGSLRPIYRAFQVAAHYLPPVFNFSTRVWTNNNTVSRISFWGTPLGRVSVIWNITNTPQTYVFGSVLPTGTLVLQQGSVTPITFTDYRYTFTLPAAPNFTWHNPPALCLVASPPLILIEPDVTPPLATIDPLPPITTQPTVTLTWSGGDDAAGVWSYDLQYRIQAGGWVTAATWLYTTTRVLNVHHGATYAFRVRARDRAGNEQAWDTAAVATTTVMLPNINPLAFVPFVCAP